MFSRFCDIDDTDRIVIMRPLVHVVDVARDIGEGKLDRRMRLPPFHAAGGDETDPTVWNRLEAEVLDLDALVGQLLAHSRVEFDRIERRPVDPVELCDHALERVGVDATCLDVQIDVRPINVDPTLWSRALTNLLRNAIEHGGGVERLAVFERDGQFCVEVRDRGPGFGQREPSELFRSFVRGANSRGGSLGLGLSLVERIAAAHQGRAWASNRPGGGAQAGFSAVW